MTAPAPHIDVILVDNEDQPIGFCEKLKAHETGALHRAISVVVTSTGGLGQEDENLILLQQRASIKYHSPNLWSNAACTHPLDGETPEQAARRALKTELGIEVGDLTYQGHFIYKTPVSTSHGEDIIEHELDHVFVAKFAPSTQIPFNPDEVGKVKWETCLEMQMELNYHPNTFTHWFPYLMRFLAGDKRVVDYRKDCVI